MQLHALDLNEKLISAGRAVRQTNYICLECSQVLRLRRGPHRQPHFYHIDPNPFCRQHQKGPVHLQLQTYFLNQLAKGDCLLEHPFPSIGRIADVAWLSKKIVFEIQCSAISAEEVLARNADYRKMGWSVVWILHDERYNQIRLSAAEIVLCNSTHYFTNMDSAGSGIIYDQFGLVDEGLRKERLSPLPIDIKAEAGIIRGENPAYNLNLLNQRANNWSFSFSGDLMHLSRECPDSFYLRQAKEKESKFYANPRSGGIFHIAKKFWKKGISTPYQIFFRFILEKICR